MDYSWMAVVIRAVKDVWGLTALMVLVVGVVIRVLFGGKESSGWVRLVAFAMMLIGFVGFLRVVLATRQAVASVPSFPTSGVCPADTSFAYLGHLYGEAGQGQGAYRQRQEVRLPENLVLDTSYHQSSVSAAGGGATLADAAL